MSLQYLVALRNQWLTDLNTALGASAKLLIYSGSMPASAASPATGTLLSSGVRGNAGGWGTVTGGVLTISNPTSDTNAAASGKAGYFRWTDASNNVVFQGTIGNSSANDLVLLDPNIAAGDVVAITSWTITAPGE